MEGILYVIGFLVLFRYGFVLIKYLKTGEFKKKVYKGNILGIIAYSFLTIFIICFLILMILVNKDNSSDLVMWMIFISGLGMVLMYPWFWQQRLYDNARSKNIEYSKKINEEFILKYGDEKYDKSNLKYFNIPDNVVIDDTFNSLVSIMTNDQISFIHPKEYKNIAEVFAFLYKKDYIKLITWNNSVDLTCDLVNSLLKNNNLNIELKSEEITQMDDKFIKARRKDLVSTIAYDLSKINEIIQNRLNNFELVAVEIIGKDEFINYPTYLCVVKTSEYNKFFDLNNNETEGGINE